QPSMCALGKEGWSHPNPSYSGGGGGSGGGKITQHHLQQQQHQMQHRPAPYSLPASRYGGPNPAYPPHYQPYPQPPLPQPHPYQQQPHHHHQQQQLQGLQDSEDSHSSRLNFCVPSGTLLGPFHVDHGLAMSRHQFELKPEVYKTLMSRADLELQFLACLANDPAALCNWPAGLTVSVNGSPVPITHQCRPVHLKQLLLQPGTGQANCLQLGLSACCCSHLFLLQLVHRPTVASVVQGLWRRRRLALESCVEKLKHLHQQQQLHQCALSLRCPISNHRIDLPARGSDCHHAQCFDLRTYLERNANFNTWRCPVCQKSAQLSGLEIDEFIFGLLEETRSSMVDRVLLDRDCRWRVPVLPHQHHQQQQLQQADGRAASPACAASGTQRQQQQKPVMSSASVMPSYPTSYAGASVRPAAVYPPYGQAPLSQPPWTYQQQQQVPAAVASQSQQQSQQQQQQQYSSSYPPTNSTNASSCSTTDPASIKTDLDDLALEPLGGGDGNFGDLLSLLDEASTGGDSLLGGII
ncbi:hypothetical protein BOX15_Mlig020144g1, partial [Macrostomum lignano]